MAKFDKNKFIKEAEERKKSLESMGDNFLNDLLVKLDSKEAQKEIFEYLEFVSRFHQYSSQNLSLVFYQAMIRNENISYLASAKTWSSMVGENGEHVSFKKGARGFDIWVPVQIKKYKRDELTGEYLLDSKGEKIPELDKDGKPKTFLGFKTGKVMDISQTDAEEIGATKNIKYRNEEAVASAELVKEVAARIEARLGTEVLFQDIEGGARGWYSREMNQICVKEDMNAAMQLSTLFHELGHRLLHNEENYEGIHLKRGAKEGEAESVSYALSKMFGVENSSELYIGTWGNDAKELSARIERISGAIKDTIKELDLDELHEKYSQSVEQLPQLIDVEYETGLEWDEMEYFIPGITEENNVVTDGHIVRYTAMMENRHLHVFYDETTGDYTYSNRGATDKENEICEEIGISMQKCKNNYDNIVNVLTLVNSDNKSKETLDDILDQIDQINLDVVLHHEENVVTTQDEEEEECEEETYLQF